MAFYPSSWRAGVAPLRCACAIVSVGVAFAPSSASAADDTGFTLRVLTYNIHHGEGVDGRLDLARIGAVIKGANADIVALQEVDQGAERTGGVDQAAKLAELTGLRAIFGKAMDYQGGAYGLAILSRFPLSNSRTHLLPTDPGFEPRALLEASVALGDGRSEILLLVTHLDHHAEPAQRLKQAAEIPQLFPAGANRPPMILAGDLNATPDVAPVTTLLAHWSDSAAGKELPTTPVAAPRRQIDYILYRPTTRLRVIDIRVLEEKTASDHRPLLAVFELVAE